MQGRKTIRTQYTNRCNQFNSVAANQINVQQLCHQLHFKILKVLNLLLFTFNKMLLHFLNMYKIIKNQVKMYFLFKELNIILILKKYFVKIKKCIKK